MNGTKRLVCVCVCVFHRGRFVGYFLVELCVKSPKDHAAHYEPVMRSLLRRRRRRRRKKGGVQGVQGAASLLVTDLHGVNVGSAHKAHHPLHEVLGGRPAGHTNPGHTFHLLLVL